MGWGPIDDWISRCLGGRALFDRLPRVSDMLANLVSPGIKIKDLGAGSGSYAFRTLGMLRTAGVDIGEIDWECVDLSDDAIQFGETRAREDGFSEAVTFSKSNFMSSKSYPSETDRADLLILVGVLCGMTKDEAANCLRKIKPHGKANSQIVAATLLTQSYKEDPWVYQLLARLGWHLKPKTMEEVEAVFSAAGYDIKAINSERFDENGSEIPGEYAIVTAELT